jgi:hypothetical protein
MMKDLMQAGSWLLSRPRLVWPSSGSDLGAGRLSKDKLGHPRGSRDPAQCRTPATSVLLSNRSRTNGFAGCSLFQAGFFPLPAQRTWFPCPVTVRGGAG